jgi:DNA-binding beta-propeller fold protein YncE
MREMSRRISPQRSPILLLTILAVGVVSGQWIEDSIDVGARPVVGLAYNRTSNVIYGGGYGAMFVLDCATNQVIASSPLPYGGEVVYDTIYEKAFCLFNLGSYYDSVLVVDGLTHSRTGVVAVNDGRYMVWNPASGFLFVSETDDNSVAVIDCRRDSVVDRVRVGRDPIWMTLAVPTQKLYALSSSSRNVTVIDAATCEVLESVRVGDDLVGGCYNELTGKFYCATSDGLYVVDGYGDTVIAVLDLMVMKMVAADTLVLAGSRARDPGRLYCIDARGDSEVGWVEVPGNPDAIAVSPTSGLVYVACLDNHVVVLSRDGSRVVRDLAVSAAPLTLEFGGVPPRLYVGHFNTTMLHVIRDTAAGVTEHKSEPPSGRLSETICRGVLRHLPTANSPQLPAGLLDITGRRVMDLKSGENDIRHVAPGVYFVREEGPRILGSKGSSVRKIVIQR